MASKSLLALICYLALLLGPREFAKALRYLGATKALTKADKTSVRNRLSGKGKKKGRGKTTKGAKHHKGSKGKGGKRKANWFNKSVGAYIRKGKSFKEAVRLAKRKGKR